MTRWSCRKPSLLWTSLAAIVLTTFAAPVEAQTPSLNGPNAGAMTFTGGMDVPSIYFFRGMRQEGDPKITLQPYGDLGIAFGDHAKVNVGVWNSLHTGTSGTGGPTGK